MPSRATTTTTSTWTTNPRGAAPSPRRRRRRSRSATPRTCSRYSRWPAPSETADTSPRASIPSVEASGAPTRDATRSSTRRRRGRVAAARRPRSIRPVRPFETPPLTSLALAHVLSVLSPLPRPLIEGYENMETSVPEDGADIARLLDGFPDRLTLRGRRVNPGQYIGLHDTRPDRQFYFGGELTSLDPDRRRRWWSLDEIVRRRRDVRGMRSPPSSTTWRIPREEELASLPTRGPRDLVRDAASGGAWRSGGPIEGDDRRPAGKAEPRGETHGAPRLIRAESLESFLGRSFPSAKRFGLEGGLALVPGLQAMVESFAARGCGTTGGGDGAPRALNILNAVFDKPLAAICAEMQRGAIAAQRRGRRYHLGFDTTVEINLPREIRPGTSTAATRSPTRTTRSRRRRRRRRRRWISPWRRIRAISRL